MKINIQLIKIILLQILPCVFVFAQQEPLLNKFEIKIYIHLIDQTGGVDRATLENKAALYIENGENIFSEYPDRNGYYHETNISFRWINEEDMNYLFWTLDPINSFDENTRLYIMNVVPPIPDMFNVYIVDVDNSFKRGQAHSIPGLEFFITENWSNMGIGFAHELGHCLGLWHPNDPNHHGTDVPTPPADVCAFMDEYCNWNGNFPGYYEYDATNIMHSGCPEKELCFNHFTYGQIKAIKDTIRENQFLHRSIFDQDQILMINKLEQSGTNLGHNLTLYNYFYNQYYEKTSGSSWTVWINDIYDAETIENIDSYKHKNWDDDLTHYRIKRSEFEMDRSDKSAQFAPQIEISIQAPSFENTYIRDPWYAIDEEQPDQFFPINSVAQTGEYSFFEGVEPDPQKPESPYYSIKTVTFLFEDNIYSVFDQFVSTGSVTILEDVRNPEDNRLTKAVRIDGAGSINVSFFENIQMLTGNLNYAFQQYYVKIDEYFADEDGIYEFKEWKASNGNVTFTNKYEKNTQVSFSNGNVSIWAEYDTESIFDKTSPPDEIVITDNLTVPPGASYGIPTNTTLKVNGGNLVISGTAENPVILGVKEPPLPKAASGSGQSGRASRSWTEN